MSSESFGETSRGKSSSAKTPPVSPSWTRSCSDLVQTWPGVGSREGEDVTHIWDVATEDRCVLLLSSPSLQLCLSDSALPSGPS